MSMPITFDPAHILDAWTEDTGGGFQIDYIKLKNGIMITISEDSVSIFDSNDFEIKGSGTYFENVVTRKRTEP